MIPTRFTLPLVTLVLGTALGMGLSWKLYRGKKAPVETAAPAVRQKDNSLILERKPEANPAPKHLLPKGSTLERQVQLQVLPNIPTGASAIPGSGVQKPSNPVQSASNPVQSASNPRPITIDLSIVKMKDGTQRVVASSPDAQIIGGLDIPTGPTIAIPKDLHWEAGVLFNPSEHTYGAYVHRSVGPFVAGLQVMQERLPVVAGGGLRTEATVSLGLRF